MQNIFKVSKCVQQPLEHLRLRKLWLQVLVFLKTNWRYDASHRPKVRPFNNVQWKIYSKLVRATISGTLRLRRPIFPYFSNISLSITPTAANISHSHRTSTRRKANRALAFIDIHFSQFSLNSYQIFPRGLFLPFSPVQWGPCKK